MTTWAEGEYPRMAERLAPASSAAVDLAVVGSGDRVVDVATGTGNAALLAAERGAEVVGVDFEPVLLAVAARRSDARALPVRWEAADATAMAVPDGWADVVVSVFGVMYAADQGAAAGELARCAAPGARIALASWAPGGFMPAMGAALSAFLPPPPALPGSGPPSRWGDPEALAELIAPHGLELVSHSVESLELRFEGVDATVDFLVRTAGHVVAARERLIDEGRWPLLLGGVGELVEERCRRDGTDVCLDLAYLLALATVAR